MAPQRKEAGQGGPRRGAHDGVWGDGHAAGQLLYLLGRKLVLLHAVAQAPVTAIACPGLPQQGYNNTLEPRTSAQPAVSQKPVGLQA